MELFYFIFVAICCLLLSHGMILINLTCCKQYCQPSIWIIAVFCQLLAFIFTSIYYGIIQEYILLGGFIGISLLNAIIMFLLIGKEYKCQQPKELTNSDNIYDLSSEEEEDMVPFSHAPCIPDI